MRRTNGFTLIEAMIVMGIISFSAAAIVSLVEYTMQTNTAQKFSTSANAGREEFRAFLSDPVVCAQAFKGIDTTKIALNTTPGFADVIKPLNDRGGNAKYSLNGIYFDRAFKLTEIFVDQYQDSINSTGTAVANLRLQSISPTLGPADIVRSVTMQITKGPNNRIIGCVSFAGMSDGLWQRVPNTTYDIFYGGGTSSSRVAINTPSPGTSATLMVKGRIWGSPECRVVKAIGAAPTYQSTASCADDEYVMSGGGKCSNLGSWGVMGGQPDDLGFMHVNQPDFDANLWQVDCYDPKNMRDIPSEAFAVCCKRGGTHADFPNR